jgi:transmembrane sensor
MSDDGMNMKLANNTRIFEQAVHWIEVFRDGDQHGGQGDRTAFFAWLAESPRNVEELNFALTLCEEIAGLTPQQRARIEELARGETTAPLPAANVVPLKTGPGLHQTTTHATASRPPVRTGQRRLYAAAAGLALAAVAAWVALDTFGADVHRTRVGEQRTVQLPDGSTVHLNAGSRLQVRYTREQRALELLEGEALFKVAPDPARPFRVRADQLLAQAIGTQFNVHRRVSGTVVSVLEGAVRVEERPDDGKPAAVELLQAGEQARLDHGGRLDKQPLANAAAVTAWRQQRLIFQNESLADIAAEFNRHNASPRITVADDIAAARHFAGTFDTDAPEALIEALAADSSLRIERKRGQIIIRARSP